MLDNRYYDIELAATIGEISRRQATVWARDGILTPSRVYVTDHRPYTHFYSFDDLVAFRVISILRKRYGVSLQQARVAADYIRDQPERSWGDRNFWLSRKQIYLSDPGDPLAIRIDLASIATEVEEDANRLWQRDPSDYGKTEYRPDIMGGTLVIRGTSISAATVANLLAAGWNIDRIRRAYPTLHPEDIQNIMRKLDTHREVA